MATVVKRASTNENPAKEIRQRKFGKRVRVRLEAILIGADPPNEVNVVVEVPVGGEPIKYEMDKAADGCSPDIETSSEKNFAEVYKDCRGRMRGQGREG